LKIGQHEGRLLLIATVTALLWKTGIKPEVIKYKLGGFCACAITYDF